MVRINTDLINKLHKCKIDFILIILVLVIYILSKKGLLIYMFEDFHNQCVNTIIRNHLNDFLAGILMCAYTHIILSVSRNISWGKYFENLSVIISFIFVCGLLWEYLPPLIRKDSVADKLDVLAYSLGGLVYWGCLSGKEKILKWKKSIAHNVAQN